LDIEVFPSYILRNILSGPHEKMKAMIYQTSLNPMEMASTFCHSHFKTLGAAEASAGAPSVELSDDYKTTSLSGPTIAQ
jgi:hypothetical protein